MKKICLYLIGLLWVLSACGGMDENYKQYLKDIPTYSPGVRNVTAVSPEVGTLVLTWELPQSDLAKSIEIIVWKTPTESQTIELDMVTTYRLTGLELQGYTFDMYTIDGFGNRSVPVSVTFTPIPGREK